MCINCGETPGFHRTTDAIQLCFDQILDINDPECIQNIAPLLLEYHQLANVPIGSLLIVMADSPLELVRIKAYKLVKNYSCIQIGLLFQRYLQLVVDDSTVCRLRASMLATYLCDKFDAGSCSWDLQTEGLLDSGEKLVFKPSVQSVGSSSANFAGWIKLLLEEIRGKLETCKVMSVVIDGSLHGYVESLMSILFYHPDQLSRINETLTNAILQIMNDITQSGLSYFSGLLNDEQDVRKNVAITTWWRSIKCIANSVTVVSRFWDDDQLRQGFDMLSSIICLDHWGVVKHATDPFVEYCKVYTKRSDLFDSLLLATELSSSFHLRYDQRYLGQARLISILLKGMNRKERKLYIPQVIDRLLELLNGDYRAEACTVLTFLISDRIVGQYLPCLDIFWSSLRHLESKQSAMVLRLLTECIPRVTCKKDDHSLKQSLDADIMVHLQMTDGSFSRATMPLLLLLDRSLTCSRTMTDKNFLDLVKFGKAQKVCHIRCLAARILARSPERCQDILEPLDWHSLNELHFKLLVLHYIPSVLSSNAALFSTVSAISASEIPLLSDLCNNLISR